MDAVAVAEREDAGRSPVADRFARIGDGVRLHLLVCATTLAYSHSLRDLLRSLSYDTPLAYVGLVPALALVLGVLRARPALTEGRAPHRHVDWMVGVPLLAAAAWIAWVVPDRTGYLFWTRRLDLLGLPLFVAGLVAILFGARVLHRVRAAVLLLVAAWPYPYEHLVDPVVGASHRFTVWALRSVVPMGGARLVDGAGSRAGGALVEIGSGARRFVVDVAPQCAGANGAVGWLLVGGFVALALPPGRRARKLAWLVAGVALLMVSNVARLVVLFAVGSTFGEAAAIEWVHPYAGLVLFLAAVAAMALLLPRFGLAPLALLLSAAPAPRPAGDHPMARVTLPVLATVVSATLALAPANAGLSRFDPFRDLGSAGAARPFAVAARAVEGWSGSRYDEVVWGARYFGPGSTWERSRFVRVSAGGGVDGVPAGWTGEVFLDVISTTDLHAFTAFGLEACYRFHDYGIARSERLDVGAAAPAQHVVFFNLDARSWWSAISWVQPTDDGGARRFERLTALAPVGGSAADVRPGNDTIESVRDGLAGFARAAVAATGASA